MEGRPDNYDELGYKRKVVIEYSENFNITFINEYVYDPNEDNIKIDDCLVTVYKGKPDIEKTKKLYKIVKTTLWNESIEGVTYEEWNSEPRKVFDDNNEAEDESFEFLETSFDDLPEDPELKTEIQPDYYFDDKGQLQIKNKSKGGYMNSAAMTNLLNGYRKEKEFLDIVGSSNNESDRTKGDDDDIYGEELED